jgi:hypothetical protein
MTQTMTKTMLFLFPLLERPRGEELWRREMDTVEGEAGQILLHRRYTTAWVAFDVELIQID